MAKLWRGPQLRGYRRLGEVERDACDGAILCFDCNGSSTNPHMW